MAVNSIRAVLLAPNDNVAAVIAAVDAAVPVVVKLNSSDETVLTVCSRQKIPFGHKIAIKDLAKGSPIVRYDYPIGVATADIKLGDHVHSHNMRSALSPASAEKAPAREIRPADWVRRKTAEVLLAAGASADAAGAMASAISEAHLRGVETHGLRRLRPYLARIRAGGVDPKAQPTKEQHGGLLMIDGRNAIGHYVAAEAAKAVSDAARQFGVAIAIVRNSNHFGFAGYYATLIAQRGQIGICDVEWSGMRRPERREESSFKQQPIGDCRPDGAGRCVSGNGSGDERDLARQRGRVREIRSGSADSYGAGRSRTSDARSRGGAGRQPFGIRWRQRLRVARRP